MGRQSQKMVTDEKPTVDTDEDKNNDTSYEETYGHLTDQFTPRSPVRRAKGHPGRNN